MNIIRVKRKIYRLRKQIPSSFWNVNYFLCTDTSRWILPCNRLMGELSPNGVSFSPPYGLQWGCIFKRFKNEGRKGGEEEGPDPVIRTNIRNFHASLIWKEKLTYKSFANLKNGVEHIRDLGKRYIWGKMKLFGIWYLEMGRFALIISYNTAIF